MPVPEQNPFNSQPSSHAKSKSTDYTNFAHTPSANDKLDSTKSKQITDPTPKLDMENQLDLLSQHSNYASETVAEPQGVNADEFYRNYSNAGDITRSTNEMITNRALVASYEYSAVRNYEHAMNGLTTGPPFDRYDMNLSSLYASSLSMQRPNISYPSYLNTFNTDEVANHQKYFGEHGGDSATPYYPKPMYHYDSTFPLGGFSAMNLALRSSAVSNPLPIMDLSAPNVTASNATTLNQTPYSMAHNRTNDTQMSNLAVKEPQTPNSSPQNNMNMSGENRRRTSSKNDAFPGQNEQNCSAYQSSKSPQSEPVDLCNASEKGAAFGADNSVDNTQNRPFSRSDSTSDSTASPYIDAIKTDSMGKLEGTQISLKIL